ncbi:predicted protein [Sclerotinia sclerotiorum 1980 UF-70]|uniref:Uncharacterized protein n=1 Tax=Sclerotinia sclerotiorum (strain ATCC 18683 / 1980 / Ss-1) TaxID=665079 RepID=A7EG10_SCLS1|nr:predicted protein [Sclerotinia sclerotiorum 1980 UF-70]EDO01776.1 predicted protein [Sclerotinia sclerotiorum 1980 UF-70]
MKLSPTSRSTTELVGVGLAVDSDNFLVRLRTENAPSILLHVNKVVDVQRHGAVRKESRYHKRKMSGCEVAIELKGQITIILREEAP